MRGGDSFLGWNRDGRPCLELRLRGEGLQRWDRDFCTLRCTLRHAVVKPGTRWR